MRINKFLALAGIDSRRKVEQHILAGKVKVNGKVVRDLATNIKDSDIVLMVTADGKGKFTSVRDFSVDSRGNKGQIIAENTSYIRRFDNARTHIYIIPRAGKPFAVDRSKLAIKGKTAIGAALTNRNIKNIL